MNNRFDYVKYDDEALAKQQKAKSLFLGIEEFVNTEIFSANRPVALSLTKLEEAYMWVGKAIRDEQIARNSMTELQEGRDDV
jgi:hypothetical protein